MEIGLSLFMMVALIAIAGAYAGYIARQFIDRK